MRFAVEPQVMARLIELADQLPGKVRRPGCPVRVIAFYGRVCIQIEGAVAEMDAPVLEEGECVLPGRDLLEALRSQPQEVRLTIQVDAMALRLGHGSIPVSGYRSIPTVPQRFQVFLATDLGAVGRAEVGEPVSQAA